MTLARFPSSPLIIRVPFFLLFGFNEGAPKRKGQKGTTGEPSLGNPSDQAEALRSPLSGRAFGCLRRAVFIH